MARIAQPITLPDDELAVVLTIMNRGTAAARTLTRARVLDLLHRGQHPTALAAMLRVSVATVFNIKRRYLAAGLDAALTAKPRLGKPPTIDGTARAKLTALACSAAPDGHARWTLRLLADKAAFHGFVETISHNTVREILKKTSSNRTASGRGAAVQITAEYLARMEDVLHAYSLPYDAKRPVVCFDELPVQLIGETVDPLPMQPNKPTRYAYDYARWGTAALLVAFEPLTGTRLVETSKHRTKADYCRFQQRVAALFPQADKLVLIQDNLNTHTASSFYESLPPEEAFQLAQRFELHYTPKKGSWLNMAELELSALARICLDRRIDSLEKLDREMQALVTERNDLRIKVQWQFSIAQARDKRRRHYDKVKSKN